MIDRRPAGNQAVSTRPRICVVDSKEVGLAYARLEQCRVEVMGSLPSLAQLSPRVAGTYDVILVACSERLLLSPGFRARAQLLSRTARLIALIQSPTPDAAGQAASLGFAGLASTDITPRALERTIAAVIHGENAFPRRLLTGLVQMISRLSSAGLSASGESALTPRQGQIVELIAQGATDREIAGVLRISQSTAHKHVQNALRRLNARTRSQLVAAARQPLFPRSLTH